LRDRLSSLIDKAALKGRSSDLVQARAATNAYMIGRRLQRRGHENRLIAEAIEDALTIIELLNVEGNARERDPETGLQFSDSDLIAAVKTSRTMTAAARKLGCNRKTISRRLKTMYGTSDAMSHFASAPCLRRSNVLRIQGEQKI
jgi:hypothetical protein